jgi:hypothetical protein
VGGSWDRLGEKSSDLTVEEEKETEMRRTGEWRGSEHQRCGARGDQQSRWGKTTARGRVKQKTGGGGAHEGDEEGSDNAELCEKDREAANDLEDPRRGARRSAHASTVHQRTQGGGIFFFYRDDPSSPIRVGALIYRIRALGWGTPSVPFQTGFRSGENPPPCAGIGMGDFPHGTGVGWHSRKRNFPLRAASSPASP